MSEAPNLKTLLDHEGQLEQTVEGYLSANLTEALVISSKSIEDRPANNLIVVNFTPGAATGHEVTPQSSHTGEDEEDRWLGTLEIAICTDREVDSENTATTSIRRNHGDLVGSVRALLLRGAIKTAGDWVSPWITILQIDFSGSDKLYDEDQNSDMTLLNYAITYGISSGSWPSNGE